MTGLIYVVIIALWAAVLIPIWLRRHDQISEVRSTARFSSAMRSLGRKDGREARRAGLQVAFDPRTRAREVAAKRRAIVMGTLSAALAVTLLLAIVSAVPRWLPVAVAVLVLSYVIAAAVTSSRRATPSVGQMGRVGRDSEGAVPAYEELDDYREVAYADEIAEVAYPTSRGVRPQTRRSRDARIAAAMDDFVAWDPWAGEDREAGDGWSAVPTTLPTYVNAPRATRVRRPIERDRDWSGEAMVEVARGMRRPRITVDDLTDDKYALGNSAAPRSDEDTAELPTLRVDAGYEETRRAAGE